MIVYAEFVSKVIKWTDIETSAMKVKILQNSVIFYLPRLEGYLETVRTIVDKY
jgi:hypothetical protein